MNAVVCGKLDDNIIDYFRLSSVISSQSEYRLRIGSKKDTFENSDFVIAATDGKVFVTLTKKENVENFIKENKKIIVLTIKEKLLVIEKCLNNHVKIQAFEEMFPVFPEIKYTSNPYKNLNYLFYLLDKVALLGYKITNLAAQLSVRFQYKIERKIRTKSPLDSLFYFSLKPGYQEVFKLKEERDKKIIALDFNSMYLDCMKGVFPDPRYLEFSEFNSNVNNIVHLYPGTYSVILKKPNNNKFIKFHPFKFVSRGRSISFNMDKNTEIRTDLLDNEITYYKNFFDEIYVINGIFSKEKISHPLLHVGLQEYANRLNYPKSDYRNNLAKYKILLMHSSTNKKFYKKKVFNELSELMSFIKDNFDIKAIDDLSEANALTEILKSYKSIFPSLKYNNDTFILEYLDYQSYNNIYSLSSRVLANSRIKMLKTILKILEFQSVEICYCNIDSIHLSVDKCKFEYFMNFISPFLSSEVGKIKIEAVASRGYWFDLGRYWLFDEDGLVKYANAGLKESRVNDVFTMSRKITKISKAYGVYYAYDRYISIFNGFSLKKELPLSIQSEQDVDFIDFMRYDVKVDDISYFMSSIQGIKLKSNLFKRISTV